MAGPTVTVLTAVRDSARYIADTIRSVQAQTFDDWEYVIVDDASSDDTCAIIDEIAAADDRLRLIRRDESGGPYVAANDGIGASRGTFIARLDGDDLAPPDRLAKQVAFIRAHPGLRACTGAWATIDEAGTVLEQVDVGTRSSRVLRWRLCVTGGVVHSTAFVERAAFEEIGSYVPSPVSADYRLWCQLAARDWLGVMGDVLVMWRQHGGQISASRLSEQMTAGARFLGDHLRDMTGETWSPDDLAALLGTGRYRDVPLRRGIDVLDRWDRLWRADAELTAAERRELARVSFRIRLRHIRHNRGRAVLTPVAGVARWGLRALSL